MKTKINNVSAIEILKEKERVFNETGFNKLSDKDKLFILGVVKHWIEQEENKIHFKQIFNQK